MLVLKEKKQILTRPCHIHILKFSTMNLYVSNINLTTKEDELRMFFQQAGEVSSVKIISDRYTGESKGFGFVDMPDDRQALGAIQQLTNTSLAGRKLVISKARERSNRY
jgi:RNA recognition motif-containing protein